MRNLIKKIKWKIDYYLVFLLYKGDKLDHYYEYLTRKWHLKTTTINLSKCYWQGKLVTPKIWINLPDCKSNLDRLVTLLKDNPEYDVRNSSDTNHLCKKENNIILFRLKNEIQESKITSEDENGEVIIYSGCTHCTNTCFKISKIEALYS